MSKNRNKGIQIFISYKVAFGSGDLQQGMIALRYITEGSSVLLVLPVLPEPCSPRVPAGRWLMSTQAMSTAQLSLRDSTGDSHTLPAFTVSHLAVKETRKCLKELRGTKRGAIHL